MVSYCWLACIGFVFVAEGILGGDLDPCPRNRGLSDGLTRAVNIIRKRALYRIDLRNAQKGYRPGKVYNFRVQTTHRKSKFNDATVVLESLDKRCDAGRFGIADDTRYSPKGCPNVVTTQEKKPMGRAYIKWKAPTCGCVHIRATVHADGQYYLENADVTNGPLARTVCPKGKYAHEVTYPRQPKESETPVKDEKRKTRRNRLRHLCRLVGDKRKLHHEFYTRRNIDELSYFEKDRLEIALEQRAAAAKECCDHDDYRHLLDCFDDVRRRRIDEFCGIGDLAVPIAADRAQWINQRKSECCQQIGEDRYTCFNYTHSEEFMLRDGHIRSENLARVSLDEFDPANDIEDYSGHIGLNTVRGTTPAVQYVNRDRKVAADSADVYKPGEGSDNVKETKRRSKDENVPPTKSDDDEEAHVENNESEEISAESSEEKDDDDESEETSAESSEEKDDDDEDEAHVENNESEETSAESSEEKDDIKQSISMTKRVCCNNGARVGATSKGIHRCFHMANRAAEYFGVRWNRHCDRHFVVCCMRVVDSTRSRRQWFTNIDGVPFAFGETPQSEPEQSKKE